jgi:hypothetical protein
MIEFIDLPEFDSILAARAPKVHVVEIKRAHRYRPVKRTFTLRLIRGDRDRARRRAGGRIPKGKGSRIKIQTEGKSKCAEAKSKDFPSANQGFSVG